MSFHTGSKISYNLIKFPNISLKEYSAPILDTNTLNINNKSYFYSIIIRDYGAKAKKSVIKVQREYELQKKLENRLLEQKNKETNDQMMQHSKNSNGNNSNNSNNNNNNVGSKKSRNNKL